MLLAALRTLWTLPTTSVGLAAGLLSMPFGTRWQFVDGVLECHSGPIAWLLERAPITGGAMAMTLGDVVLGRNEAALDLTRTHERVHVRQCHRWGPFFIPAYLLVSAWIWLKPGGGDAYRDNPFERQAFAVSNPRHF